LRKARKIGASRDFFFLPAFRFLSGLPLSFRPSAFFPAFRFLSGRFSFPALLLLFLKRKPNKSSLP
jgi:hypothetical protein